MLSRLRAMRHDGDRGMTLTEVMVGASLAGVAGVIGMGLFVVVSDQANDTTSREQRTSDGRAALSQLVSELQLADSPTANVMSAQGRFEVFQANKVVFYANRYTTSRTGSLSRLPPSRVSITQVDDTASTTAASYNKTYRLEMSIWDPVTKYGTTNTPYPSTYSYASNYNSAPTQTVVLARGIANDVTKASEALFTYCSSTPDPAPSSEPTTTATTTPSASTTPTPTPTATSSTIPPQTTTTAGCNPINWTSDSTTNTALARQISSVVVRLKVAAETDRTSSDQYRATSWLVGRVAISGPVDPAPDATSTGTP